MNKDIESQIMKEAMKRIPNYVFGYGDNMNNNSISLHGEIPLSESCWSFKELRRFILYRHNRKYHIHQKYGQIINITPIHINPEMDGVVV